MKHFVLIFIKCWEIIDIPLENTIHGVLLSPITKGDLRLRVGLQQSANSL